MSPLKVGDSTPVSLLRFPKGRARVSSELGIFERLIRTLLASCNEMGGVRKQPSLAQPLLAELLSPEGVASAGAGWLAA